MDDEREKLEMVRFSYKRGKEDGAYSLSGNSTPDQIAKFLTRALKSGGWSRLRVMIKPR